MKNFFIRFFYEGPEHIRSRFSFFPSFGNPLETLELGCNGSL